jgi:N-acetylglucosamine-6-phosphate deacetylase
MTTSDRRLHYCIESARIPGYAGLQHIGVGEDHCILWIRPMNDGPINDRPINDRRLKPSLSTLNMSGDWVSLGGVDLQINGGLGLAFPDLTVGLEEKLEAIATYLYGQGVDAFLPTLVTTANDNIHRALGCLAEFEPKANQPTAEILGAHLEGPFLNIKKRGAHPEEYIQPLTLDRVQQVLGNYGQCVKVMTLAPELDPSGETLEYLRSQNIIVSLGHSLATAEEAQKAFAQGATMVTHAFNAMPPLHHREPGLLGAAVVTPGVYCGFIADGQHVDPLMLQWLLRASNPGELFLVSDALAPLGLPDGVYPWDSRHIEVKQGTARLEDGTLSGTTLPLLVGVQNLVRWGVCSIEMAIALATETPRKALGLPGIGIGQSAKQLLRWSLDSENHLSWRRLQGS